MNRFVVTRILLPALFLATLALATGGPVPTNASAMEASQIQFDLWGNFSSVSSEPSHLSIAPGEGEANVSWPLALAGWVLEQSPDLTSSGAWVGVPLDLYQSDSTNLSVAFPSISGNMFYRLRKLAAAIPGLTGNWTFDEEQGGIAQDISGNAHNLELSNVVWAVGRIGPGALRFNGGAVGGDASRAWLSNTNFSVLPSAAQPFSVSFWLSPDVLKTGWSGLMGNDANGSNGWHLALHTPGPGTNYFVFAAAGLGSLNVTARTLLIASRWYELTATYDGQQGAIYLDGKLLAQAPGTLLPNSDPIWFGGGVGTYDSFAGRMDELRICTNAPSAEAISLAGEWRFDENAGAIATDSSIRGHHTALSSPAGWTAGKNGSAVDLGHSTVLIRNDYSDVLPPTGGPFSVSFWLRPGLLTASPCGLMSCADGTNTGWSLGFYSPWPGQTWLDFSSTNSGGTLALAAPVDLAEGVWTKFDLTYNGGIATLYVNGRKVRSDSGGIQGNTTPLRLGANSGMASFDGALDELKIYRRERAEAEIGPVAKVIWETVLVNTTTNLVLQGFGPAGKTLTYTVLDSPTPSRGTVQSTLGSATVTYSAGGAKGPDSFAYTVSDGEFTSVPTMVALSVVQPHWLAPDGGSTPPLDGSSPEHAWLASPADVLDAIWHTNSYYDCFFYAPGEYLTSGCNTTTRGTALRGCKHVGSGSEGPARTTLKLVNTWGNWSEGTIFAGLANGDFSMDFEVRDMTLDCNALNNPKFTKGEPVWITLPLAATGWVDTVTLHWQNAPFINGWRFGPAQNFTVCTRMEGTNGFITNCSTLSSTGQVDVVPIQADVGEISIRFEQRSPGVDFYSLSEIEVAGPALSLPSATTSEGAPSRLEYTPPYGIFQAVDGNDQSAWASGPEDQVRIELPLASGTRLSQLTLFWNCETIDGVGRLGPAAYYQIHARDPDTGQFYDVPFVAQPRSNRGVQANVFGNPGSNSIIVTDRLVLLLNVRELGVDYYSLAEVLLQNGSASVPLKIPSALNSLLWGNYHVLRAVDQDTSTAWASDTQGMLGAIMVTGNNLKFSNLKVVGFGTKAARECFPIAVSGPTPDYDPLFQVGNVLIENCVLIDPAPSRDGLTGITVAGQPPHILTNVLVRGCTVANGKFNFRFSQGFSSVNVENCVVSNCNSGVYFEPNSAWGESVGHVLVRSNLFLNVENGVNLIFAAGAHFDSLTCLDNEVVLTGAGQWGVAACDTCSPGLTGSVSNLTALNNIVRFPDWSPRPATAAGGFYCGNIRNAVFGNNIVALGTAGALRLRACPSGSIAPPRVLKICDGEVPVVPPPTLPPCLDLLPPGYRRAWFNNHDLLNTSLAVRYWTTNSDGFASQQQWP